MMYIHSYYKNMNQYKMALLSINIYTQTRMYCTHESNKTLANPNLKNPKWPASHWLVFSGDWNPEKTAGIGKIITGPATSRDRTRTWLHLEEPRIVIRLFATPHQVIHNTNTPTGRIDTSFVQHLHLLLSSPLWSYTSTRPTCPSQCADSQMHLRFVASWPQYTTLTLY